MSSELASSLPQHPEHDRLLAALNNGEFAFLDLGCGAGDSVFCCERQFCLGPGIGFDIAPHKIEAAIAKGIPAILADLTVNSFAENLVSFCTMMDFLEHLRSEAAAVEVLEKASLVARDFLFIRHPSFEEGEYLESLGLRLDWSNWSGHRNMMRLADFQRVFAQLGWQDYAILPRKQILSSKDPAIVPFDAPIDTVRYRESLGPKEIVTFNRPIWTQFDIYVRLSPNLPDSDWLRILETSHAESILARTEETLSTPPHRTTRERVTGYAAQGLQKLRHLGASRIP